MHISVREDGSRTLRTIRSRPRCFLQNLSSSVGHVKNNDWSHGSNPLAYWHQTTTDTCQTKLNHLLLHPTCFLVFKASIAHDLAKQIRLAAKKEERELTVIRMATSIMASMALKSSPSPFSGQSQLQRIQPSARSSSFRVMSKKAKKVQTSQPFGPGGGLELKDGVDASGRLAKGKGVYQFASKYGANVDGAAQYITQKNGLQVVTTMREERHGCCSGWLLLLEFCWVVLCLFTILVLWLLEAWYRKPDYVPCKDLHHLG
ncbi:hypothetical protein CFC21_023328 [Triticum aestivum]|nr:hypothetical protein CFC21_023328 [Triticum aestivum]